MKETVILRTANIYRDDFRLRAFTFGEGEEALCIVGSSRGNEYQQIFTCSRVLQRLKKLEAEGRFEENRQVMVIPTLNPASMNIGKRFWSIDNTDINRMFPGYALGGDHPAHRCRSVRGRQSIPHRHPVYLLLHAGRVPALYPDD